MLSSQRTFCAVIKFIKDSKYIISNINPVGDIGVRSNVHVVFCIVYQNGLLGRELKKGFVPLQPQPDPASIVVVKRKYSTSSRLIIICVINHKKNVFFNARWNVLSNRFLPLSTLEDLIDRHEFPI
jgi:hypothetical protein